MGARHLHKAVPGQSRRQRVHRRMGRHILPYHQIKVALPPSLGEKWLEE